MLPERRKNLLITIGVIVGIIIVVIVAFLLSKFLRNKTEVTNRRDDSYASNYDYFGVLKDSDGIYRLYGINNKDEDYLGVRTFYDVQDLKVINNHIIFYSDAVNEVRFDETTKEYYLMELNGFYSNKHKMNITDDNLILRENNTLSYLNYDKTYNNKKDIAKNLENDNILVTNNLVYYTKDNAIIEYNLETRSDSIITTINNSKDIEFVDKKGNYLYFYNQKDLFIYDVLSKEGFNVNNYFPNNLNFIDTTDEGFLYQNDNNELRLFSIAYKRDEGFSFVIDAKINFSKEIKSGVYFLKVDNKNLIVDVLKKNILRELDQDYLYIVRVN